MGAFFAIVLSLLALFLILLVLVQRGRGGGLAGALGGMGGSSAFGAKAGDVFTRITVVTAAIWIVISLMAVFWANHRGDVLGTARPTTPADAALDVLPQAPPGQKGDVPTARPAEKADSAPAESSPPATNDAAPATEQ
ncbi:MAG: preprotein translocase subunit SecG [Pirellulales bacterium]